MKDSPLRINDKALSALENNRYETAQKLFYFNKKTYPCYQAYNNLGIYLYDNGIILKSGKVVAARAIGKEYVLKSLAIKKCTKTYKNIARIFIEENNYELAQYYYSLVYQIEPNDVNLYNRMVSYGNARDYYEAYKSGKLICNPSADMIFPILFCASRSDSSEAITLFKRFSNISIFQKIDSLDRLVIFYLFGMYKSILEMSTGILNEWSIDDGTLAIIVDSVCKEVSTPHYVKEWINSFTSSIDINNAWKRRIGIYLKNEPLRTKKINDYLKLIQFQPIYECGYFGCHLHDTSWL
jgi:tetratricopeptide (TPR) repeat protein